MPLTRSSPPAGWMGLLLFLAFVRPLSAAPISSVLDTNTPVARALRKAGNLFQEQHWAEARAAYDAVRGLENDWVAPPVRLAVEGAVACSLKLSQWDDALARAQNFVAGTKGKFEEAIGEVQQLDQSTNKNDTARALFRWTMIARTLYGPESAGGYSSDEMRLRVKE